MTRTIIRGGTLLTPQQTLTDYTLIVEAGKIAAIERDSDSVMAETVIDADGLWVAPGMIDVHVHGSDGCDTMDATPEALHGMARFFAAHGVTSYLPTTMTESGAAILAATQNAANTPQPTDGAQHIGVHLEGPYLNLDFKGAQAGDYIRPPDRAEFDSWTAAGNVRLMTIAPESPGALELIEYGVSRGVEFAVGHSGATFEQMGRAADAGLRQGTHTYNAMGALNHRRPGTLGAVMSDDRIYAQLIGDGVHVHPAAVKILVRAKGMSRVILITDAIRAAGMPDGDYDLGGQTALVRNGIARLDLESDTLAGSTATMDAVLRNVMRFAGLSLVDALPMATSVPAEALGLSGRKGVLAAGADADIVLFDADLNVHTTIVAGRIVYRRG